MPLVSHSKDAPHGEIWTLSPPSTWSNVIRIGRDGGLWYAAIGRDASNGLLTIAKTPEEALREIANAIEHKNYKLDRGVTPSQLGLKPLGPAAAKP